MRDLYVLRHGKSDWGDPGLADFDRSLAPRGVRAAGVMGRFLARCEEVPDLVLTSSAVRAAQTVELAAREGAWACAIEPLGSLYGASCAQLLEAIQGAPSTAERVLVVAHEPGLSEFIGRMIGAASIRFPTAALARIELAGERWDRVELGQGTLRWLVTPRSLAAFTGR